MSGLDGHGTHRGSHDTEHAPCLILLSSGQ